MAGVCSWCWIHGASKQYHLCFSLCFFLTLVDQVTVFVSVGVCAVAGAVSQVSFDFKQVPRGWGINMHIFVFLFLLHHAACGRRRMSPSARHKQSLVKQEVSWLSAVEICISSEAQPPRKYKIFAKPPIRIRSKFSQLQLLWITL